LAYGIPREVQARRRDAALVVVNVSRMVIDDARHRLQPVHIVAVTAPPDMLAERLARRGRESATELASRVPKAEIELPAGPDVTRVVNDRSLADGVAAFVAALQAIRAQAI
jgi:ribose 1,5-bisphosphokinase